MTRTILALGLAAFALTGCSGKYMGLNTCDSKGAVVWFQQPDKNGQYHDEKFQECKR